MPRESLWRTRGRLRPIWRFLLSAVMAAFATVLAGVLVGLVVGLTHRYPSRLQALAFTNLLTLPLLLLAFKFLSDLFEGKPLAAAGLGFRGRWLPELAHGLILGAVMMLLIAGAEGVLGVASFSWNFAAGGSVAVQGLILTVVLLAAAANEELTFRGYPFQRLVDSIGPVGAVVVMSALFGAIHLGNPQHTWFSTLNTMLIGVAFAIAYLRTRALWLPLGIHFAWNLMEGYGLGFPVSGIVLHRSLVVASVHGPAWLTGGNYGPEGGLLVSLIALASTVYLLRAKSVYTSKEMRELVDGTATEATRAREPSPETGAPGNR